MKSRASQAVQTLVLTLAALAFTTLLCEGVVRMFAPQHASWLPIYRMHPAVDVYAPQPNLDTKVEAGDGAYAVKTDANGWRVGASAQADARPVMLVAGDSYTFGQGVAYEESFVGALDADPRVAFRPINLGVGGYGPKEYRLMLEYALAQNLSPRFVLVAVYPGNDFMDVLLDKSSSVRDGILNNPQTLRSWAKRSFHLYRLVSNAYHRFAPAIETRHAEAAGSPADWKSGRMQKARTAFAAELAAIKAACAARGVPLGVVLIPTKQAVDAARAESGEADLPMLNALAICDEVGLHCLDLTAPLAEHAAAETHLRVDGHFSPLGGRIAAAAIASEFQELARVAMQER